MAPVTHGSFSNTILCVYYKLVRTSLFGAEVCVTAKLMYLMTAYYTPNDGLTANDAASYTLRWIVFSISYVC